MSALPLNTPAIDLSKLVDWRENNTGSRYRVGAGDSRAGQVGTILGVVGLRHVGGYEVVMQMDDGKVSSFSPMSLFPELDRATEAESSAGKCVEPECPYHGQDCVSYCACARQA